MTLTREEIRRYSRHLLLPEVGLEGQQRLQESRVLIVGLGGLGSPLAMYLAAAGVGRIGLLDDDRVEITNLQRQILYGEEDLGRPKVEAAAERLRGINPHVEFELHRVRLDRSNALQILDGYDCIADGTDNFPTRYLVNDACVQLGKPDVYGSILRFEGQCSVFGVEDGPCYRCLFPQPPPAHTVPSCSEAGVLGLLPGVIGSLQGMEVVKLLLGQGRPLVGRLLLFDGLEMEFRTIRVQRDPACPVCGEHPTLTELVDYDAFCSAAPGPDPGAKDAMEGSIPPKGRPGGSMAPTEPGGPPDMTVEELARRIEEGSAPLILDVREQGELEICRMEGARHIPLGELADRLEELDPRQEVVVLCHHGYRSAYAVALLRRKGFVRARNLVGGIEAWAAEVDPTMVRY